MIKRDQVTAGDPVWVVYWDDAVWLVRIDRRNRHDRTNLGRS